MKNCRRMCSGVDVSENRKQLHPTACLLGPFPLSFSPCLCERKACRFSTEGSCSSSFGSEVANLVSRAPKNENERTNDRVPLHSLRRGKEISLIICRGTHISSQRRTEEITLTKPRTGAAPEELHFCLWMRSCNPATCHQIHKSAKLSRKPVALCRKNFFLALRCNCPCTCVQQR